MRSLVVVAVLAAGCAKEPTPAPEPAPAVTPPAAASADAGTPPGRCVEECVAKNQMRATAIEVIEQECRTACAAPAGP